MTTQSNQDKNKECLFCKSTNSVIRVDQIINQVEIDGQIIKEIKDKQWISLLLQQTNNEKYLCEKCYNEIMPMFLIKLQDKQEPKEGYFNPQLINQTMPKMFDKKIEENVNQSNIFNNVPVNMQAQFLNEVKGFMQLNAKNDQGFSFMNNQYNNIPQGIGINQQLFNDKQFLNLLNDFGGQMKNQNIPNYSLPIPPFQGMNTNQLNQNEINQKVLLMMVYEAITVFFNQTLKNTTNILENIQLLINMVYREVIENGLNSFTKNKKLELYLYKTAEQAMQTIFSIQVFHEQLKKLVFISLTPQEIISNPQPFVNINPNEAEFINFLKTQNQMNNQDIQMGNFNQMAQPQPPSQSGNFNQMAQPQPPSQSMNANEQINSSMQMMAQFQNLQGGNKESKPQQIPQPNITNNNLNQNPLSQPMQNLLPPFNFYLNEQLNNLFATQALNPADLMNFINIIQENQPKQQQPMGSNSNNLNGLLSNALMMNQNKPQGQELQQQLNYLLQTHPELPAALMNFQKMFDQKSTENNINSGQYKQ